MPTPTVYSSSGTQWPILQSKTEQKFKSGLFNVSAEFIRPSGNISLPEKIETSIGEVDVWPEPTVSVGTDGFERISATGYGLWDETIYEVRNYTVGEITASITQYINPTTDPDTGTIYYDTATREIAYPGFIFEIAHIKTIRQKGSLVLPAAPNLKVLNSSSDSSSVEINEFYLPQNFITFIGVPGAIQKTIQISNVVVNHYGSIEEVEVVYSITKARANFLQTPP
jgi:hypothetical protein